MMKSAPNPLGRRINPGAGANRPAPLFQRTLTFAKYNPQNTEKRGPRRGRVDTTV
jgi:hypothetical protein